MASSLIPTARGTMNWDPDQVGWPDIIHWWVYKESFKHPILTISMVLLPSWILFISYFVLVPGAVLIGIAIPPYTWSA